MSGYDFRKGQLQYPADAETHAALSAVGGASVAGCLYRKLRFGRIDDAIRRPGHSTQAAGCLPDRSRAPRCPAWSSTTPRLPWAGRCHKCHCWTCAILVLAEDISALSNGTKLAIEAKDHARPIVTTTAITVNVRIASPLSDGASQ